MKLELVQIKDLKLDPRNARLHNKKNLDAIKGSLTDFDQQKNIVISQDGLVVAGNGTVTAAIAAGRSEIWAYRTTLDKRKQKAFALADNRAGELATWDDAVLKEILQELKDEEYSVDDIGFDLDEFGLGKSDGLTDDDAVPEVPQNVHSVVKGDIWQLGEHRLMCGDSTSKDDVAKLMDGEKADMVFTDPPYGVSAVSVNGKIGASNLAKTGTYKQIIGDETTNTAQACYDLCSSLGIQTLIFWGGNYYSAFCPPKACWIVWDKRGDMASNNFADCELAWTNLDSPSRIYKQIWSGMIKEGESAKRIHPTQKPIALAEWCFENFGKPKSVLDLFLGSGSTLIACEKTNRKCYGMEIDPHYCSVIIERWQQFSGKQAKLLNKADDKAIVDG